MKKSIKSLCIIVSAILIISTLNTIPVKAINSFVYVVDIALSTPIPTSVRTPTLPPVQTLISISTPTPTSTLTPASTAALTPTPTPENPFPDIDDVTWARDSIITLYNFGTINGYEDGTFRPDDCITRAELVKIISVAFDLYDPDAESTYTDVSKDKWYYSYIASFEKAGIITGYCDGSFLPDRNVSRQEVFKIFANTLLVCNIISEILSDDDAVATELNKFNDGNDVGQWASFYTATLIKCGLVTGSPAPDGKGFIINPYNSLTRAETAVIIDRAMKLPDLTQEPAPTSCS